MKTQRRAAVEARYDAMVLRRGNDHCWPWLGALHPRTGHGRFWVARQPNRNGVRGQELVVIAHRYGYGLVHGYHTLTRAPVIAHRCDESWCQNPTHMEESTQLGNQADYQARRWHPRSPLRDVRGQYGRALAVRAAARAGGDLDAAKADGVSALDRGQLELW